MVKGQKTEEFNGDSDTSDGIPNIVDADADDDADVGILDKKYEHLAAELSERRKSY